MTKPTIPQITDYAASIDLLLAARYWRLSVRAIQAVALLAVGQWLEQVGLRDPELDELLEHLWAWMLVDQASFDAWHLFDSDVLGAALGDDLPPELAERCRQLRIEPETLRKVLESLTEITYGNLYALPDRWITLRFLLTVLELTGVGADRLPRAEDFGQAVLSRCSAAFRTGDQWGRPTPDDVRAWRALA